MRRPERSSRGVTGGGGGRGQKATPPLERQSHGEAQTVYSGFAKGTIRRDSDEEDGRTRHAISAYQGGSRWRVNEDDADDGSVSRCYEWGE